MTRRALVRGIQLLVAITLVSFGVILYQSIRSSPTDLAAGFADIRPPWILLAAAVAVHEGIFGGLRVWLLGRVLWPELRARTGIASEFSLMFAAGATPAQAGSMPAQIAVLMQAGMRLTHVAATEVMVGTCTIFFYLTAAVAILFMRWTGLLVVEHGEQIDWLLIASATGFGIALVAIVLSALNPALTNLAARGLGKLLTPPWRLALGSAARVGPLKAMAARARAHRGAILRRVQAGIDDVHAGFRVYARRGKRAYLLALLATYGLFISRFSVAYFVLLGLGLGTTASSFVMGGPDILQILVIQTLLNFALYFSPTPGASGIAEAGSAYLMAPWLPAPFVLPFLVLWRVLALFLSMFVGGVYVFHFLGTDVLEERSREADAEKRARPRVGAPPS